MAPENQAADPLVGTLVDGRYRIDRVVGQGGFGTVYAAYHLFLQAPVALKVPRVDLTPGFLIPDLVATFVQESRVLKTLRHHNIVAALDVGLLPPGSQGFALPYLVLEWCAGPTLKDWFERNPGPRHRDAAWSLLKPVFEAIAYAHAHGVAHRDIKPANILLENRTAGHHGSALVPRVIDFGIAKHVDAAGSAPSGGTQTTAARIAYTPRYAAPEQLAGLRSGPWSDVYALALLLLEAMLGRPVFASDLAARASLIHRSGITPRELGLNLADWEAPITRALSANPGDRFANAGEFLFSLDRSAFAHAATAWSDGHNVVPQSPSAVGHGAAAAAREPDATASPASHTLRTSAQIKRNKGSGMAWAAALVSSLLVVGGIAAGVFFRTRWLGAAGDRKPEPADSGLSTGLGVVSPGDKVPLDKVTAAQLKAWLTSAGVFGCQEGTTDPHPRVDCAGANWGTVKQETMFADINTLEDALKSEGLGSAKTGTAFRYFIASNSALRLVIPEARADAVVEVLSRHLQYERSGREKVYTTAPMDLPARLRDWKQADLGQRVRDIGCGVQGDRQGMVTLACADGYGTCLLYLESGAALAASIRTTKTAGAFAHDGPAVLACYAPGRAGSVEFVRELLGTSRAEVIESILVAGAGAKKH